MTPQRATEVLSRLVAHRGHRYWKTLPAPDPARLTHVLGHQQIQDAYLVSLAERYRGRLATIDHRLAAHAAAGDSVCVIPA